ncbi:4-alpha-glucanotransferase [Candidatus Lokiarchaeum ossiferum]|uniref:4-alpha-glucanotransferase n=1 Tax=Candidatus Lokiarchaeum ossiferum TaxID=2951803 RepID=UPI00352C3F13
MRKTNSIPRSAGILLHPTSFHTPFGIGDFGSKAIHFIQYLKKCGQKFWQILPLGPTGYADSPYQCISTFAGNPLLISMDGLIKMQLITQKEVMQCFETSPDPNTPEIQWTISTKINYQAVRKSKYQVFEISYNNFIRSNYEGKTQFLQEFSDFCREEKDWLDDFVLFTSLKNQHDSKSWIKWPEKYRNRRIHSNAIKVWIAGHKKELDYYRFIQWIFAKQWKELKTYANKQGIQIIGDMPIFVAHDSVDVWSNPDLFSLDSSGILETQAGVPPDYFSPTGQLWGNPLYNWKQMELNGFKWFIRRFKKLADFYDWIRIDHFRGFEAFWEVDGIATDAIKGKWVKAPGEKLFKEVEKELGRLPIFAEDLGIITPEVEQLRDKFDFPGMKVMQFAFGDDSNNPHLPHNVIPNSIVYSGTHDNDTTVGWWQNRATKEEKEMFMEYLNAEGMNIIEDMIKGLYRTSAKIAIIPIQDLLGLGSKSRMNTPSVTQGNWQFRLKYGDLSEQKAIWIRKIASLYGRLPVDPKS